MFSPGDRVVYKGANDHTGWGHMRPGVVKEVRNGRDGLESTVFAWVQFDGGSCLPCMFSNLEYIRPLTAFEESVRSYIVEAKRELGL